LKETHVIFTDENFHSTKSILLLKSQVSVTVMHAVSVVGVAGWLMTLMARDGLDGWLVTGDSRRGQPASSRC